MEITLDHLLSGTLGAVIGALTTVWFTNIHATKELRRKERLQCAFSIYVDLREHLRNTARAGQIVDDRDLRTLVNLQRWWLRRRRASAAVTAYQQACSQRSLPDSYGQVQNANPDAVRAAIEALLPFTEHR